MKGIYGVYDVVALAVVHGLSIFANDAAAIRSFGEVLLDPNSPLSKHPGDYDLHYLGEVWDLPNGVSDVAPCINSRDQARLVVKGSVLVAASSKGAADVGGEAGNGSRPSPLPVIPLNAEAQRQYDEHNRQLSLSYENHD